MLSQDEGRRVSLGILEALGYDSELYRSDYPVWLGGNNSRRASFVAFGRTPLDMTTATAVVEVARHGNSLQDASDIARALAAPIIVLLADTEALFYLVNQTTAPQVFARVDPNDRPNLSQLSQTIGPKQLLRAKLGHRQLGLFPVPVGLLDSARERSERNLGPLVDAALETAAEMTRLTLFEIEGTEQGERLHKQAARIVVGALTALALRDKEGLQDLSPSALADTSQQRYAHYFRWLQEASSTEHETLEAIISILGDGVDYRSLDPRVLASVYENSLVSDAHRRALGTHYTPTGLARLILRSVPLEEIRPENRLVLDPTCGSGGLLLAAHDRLRDLQPDSLDPAAAHSETVAQLRGMDRDDFAVELARLSLLLNAYPAGNGWHIRQADVLKTTLTPAETPSLIVANPPWRNTNSAGARREVADQFLGWMVDALAPGGFLAVVLPAGWLNNRSSSAARRDLQQVCDLFEVWRLPETVFESSSMASSVLFARKRLRKNEDGRRQYLLKRVVRSDTLSQFYATGRADETALLMGSDAAANSWRIAGGLLTQQFVDVPHVLDSLATIVTGPQPRPGVVARTKPVDDGNALYLPRATALPYLDDPARESLILVNFPADFQDGSRRGAIGLGQSKILISAARSPDNPWRLRVGLDRRGIIARNSMQMVLPLDPTNLLGLAAFLASTFASAWIDETVPDRNISTSDVRSIPITTDPDVWVRLNDLGARLTSTEGKRRRHSLLRELDDLVWSCLGVPAETQSNVVRRFQGFPAPDGVVRHPPSDLLAFALDEPETSDEEKRETFGATLAARAGEVCISIAGVTDEEGDWTKPPSGISGWMARPGSTFNAELPVDGDITKAEFVYQIDSWLDDEELEEAAFGLSDSDGPRTK